MKTITATILHLRSEGRHEQADEALKRFLEDDPGDYHPIIRVTGTREGFERLLDGLIGSGLEATADGVTYYYNDVRTRRHIATYKPGTGTVYAVAARQQ